MQQPRMTNIAKLVPDVVKHLTALAATAEAVPHKTVNLVHLRASQINGCGVCVEGHARIMKKSGEQDERIFALTAWRDAPYYSDAERAALALTEAVTRLSDRPEPVTDEIWNEAAKHYDEQGLASLLIQIAAINAFNRLNAPTRQLAGEWKP